MRGGHSLSGKRPKRVTPYLDKLPYVPRDFTPSMRERYRTIGSLLLRTGGLPEGSIDALVAYIRVLDMADSLEAEIRTMPKSDPDTAKVISSWRMLVDQARKYQNDLRLTPATCEPESQSEEDQAVSTFAKYAR